MNQILHSPGDDHLLTARALRVMKNYGGEGGESKSNNLEESIRTFKDFCTLF